MNKTTLCPFTKDTDLTNYMPLPREILTLDLPKTAVLLYAALLDRGTLSRKNEFTDETGWVYVIYTIDELAETIGVSTTIIKRNLKLLEERGLLFRKRPVGNKASNIYLCIPAGSAATHSPETSRTTAGAESHRRTGRKIPTNNITKQQNLNNNYYQHSGEESL